MRPTSKDSTLPPSIEGSIEFLASHARYMTQEHAVQLGNAIPLDLLPILGTTLELRSVGKPGLASNDPIETSNLQPTGDMLMDLRAEILQQMNLLQILRKNVAQKADKLSNRDLKDMVNTTNSLFSMLTRLSTDILSQDRVQKLESAIISTVKTLDVEQQDLFFKTLESDLESVP